MEIVKKLIRGVEEFPTLPTVYSALADIMANPNSTAAAAARVISSDQASAAKVLKTANSSMYGFRQKIGTITQAIFLIGFTEVKNLVLALSIIDLFKKSKVTELFNPVDLWKHSIAVGVITRLLGKLAGASNVENFFIAGILHDIGKLLFLKNMEDEYSEVLAYAAMQNMYIRDAETKILGMTHTVAGELISEKWKLPVSLRNCIRYHYNGTCPDEKDKLLTASVHIANVIARALELGNAGDNVIPKPNEEAWDILKLPPKAISQVVPKIILDYEESMQIFLLK